MFSFSSNKRNEVVENESNEVMAENILNDEKKRNHNKVFSLLKIRQKL